MKAGFASRDITPELGMPTELYQNLHIKKIVSPVLLKVCILQEKGQSAVIVTGDVMDFFTDSIADMRAIINNETGVPVRNIFINSSHSHSSLYIYPGAQKYLEQYETCFLDNDYYKRLLDALRKACVDAVKDIEEVRVRHSRGIVSGVASTRRPLLYDGTIGVRWGRDVPEDLRNLPDGLIDPYVECVWFDTVGGREKGLLFNYACHGTSYGDYSEICWDYMGYAREMIEKRFGVKSMFLQGCAGNISPGKYTVRKPLEDAVILGGRLADAVIKSREGAVDVPDRSFTVLNESIILKGRVTLSKEQLKQKLEKEIEDTKREQASGVTEPAGAMVISYVERLLMLEKHPDLNFPNEVGLVSIGGKSGLSMFFLPSECFVQYALAIKRHRGKSPTLVMGYADCTLQYIPDKTAFEETGGYETDPDWSYSEKGNGEKLVEAALKLSDIVE